VYELKEAKHLAEIKLNTELMTNMEVLTYLSRRGGTAVYSVRSLKSDQLYVLKHISVPESQKQVEALLFTGAASDEAAAQEYYAQVVADYQQELEQLEALSSSPNLRCFRSYEIKPKEDAIGFDVYLLAEYRPTLEESLADAPMSQASAVNLAMDLCSALMDLRAAGLIHRTVKPSNIFLNAQGHYMLGDLGIARIDQLKYCSMPESMLSPYSAPELFDLMANVNETIDLYSVGLILYRLYNGNHAPMEDERTTAKAADKLRITGHELPAPMFADYEMAEIICKACAFKPEDRYQTPEEMKQALTDYMLRNQVGDDPVIPPLVLDEAPVAAEETEEEVVPVQFADVEEMDEDFKQSFSPDNDMLNALIESVHREEYDFASEYDELDEVRAEADGTPVHRKRRKLTTWLPTVLVLAVILALVAAAVWFFFIRVDTLTIDSIAATEQTVDSLTVTVQTEEEPGKFDVVCADSYGTVYRQAYTGEPVVFTQLVSGAQYTISVEGYDRENIAGVPSIQASTMASTNVISLTANRVTVDDAELTFVIDGTEPQEWLITYGPTGGDTASKVFTGHSVVLTGLDPDTEYTAVLQDTSDVHLTGSTNVVFRTLPSVTIKGDVSVQLSAGVAVIDWDYEGQAPSGWTITCTGTEGYETTQTVRDSMCTLEDLKNGETYTVLINSDSMLSAASIHFTPNALSIAEFTAAAGENGAVELTWITEADPGDTQWLIICRPVGNADLETATQAEGTSLTLNGLIPGVSYVFEIQAVSGDRVGGATETTLTMPEAEQFRDYGFSTAYVSTWLRPEGDWTSRSLSTIRTSYKPTELIAFACQSISTPRDSEDVVSTLLAVRNADGELVDYYVGEEVWSNMWSKNGNNYLYIGELLRTPQTPGKYTLEIYFNGKLVKTGAAIEFSIT